MAYRTNYQQYNTVPRTWYVLQRICSSKYQFRRIASQKDSHSKYKDIRGHVLPAEASRPKIRYVSTNCATTSGRSCHVVGIASWHRFLTLILALNVKNEESENNWCFLEDGNGSSERVCFAFVVVDRYIMFMFFLFFYFHVPRWMMHHQSRFCKLIVVSNAFEIPIHIGCILLTVHWALKLLHRR